MGEPVFGRKAADVSMGRLLAQLFEITALFDMRLRPELVLLQKTMVTVEGVARRIDPGSDIWAAADPVVRRWIVRELSPAARVRGLVNDARAVVSALARAADRSADPPPPAPTPTPAPAPQTTAAEPPPMTPSLAFLMGVLVAALTFVVAVYVAPMWLR